MPEWVIPLVSVILGALSGWGAASFKIGEYKNKVDTLEKTVGHDEHGGLRKTLGDVRDKVIACETNLALRGPLGKVKSPISLTDRGNNVLKDSGGKLYVDEHQAELLKFIKEKTPKSAYDVQEFAKEAMKLKSEEDDFIPLKNYAFKEGLGLEDILFVTGIYLRDLSLPKLGFKPEDVDKTDPKNGQK